MKDKFSYNLILLGGTGARCGELFIHMCANGYFECKSINILFIDSDSKNGNAQSFKRVLKLYQDCQEKYRIESSPISCFFKPEIKFMEANPVQGITYFKDLANLSGKDQNDIKSAQMMMKALYNEEECEMKISDGFFAHPNVGAALFAANMGKVMQQFLDYVRIAQKDMKEIRIFMLGSIFGGTGASSLPTIAKYLKQELFGNSNNKLIGEQMKIGGCLILPYFAFSRKNLEKKILSGEEMEIESDKFVTKTISALKYYKELEETDRKAFDSLYILGHDGMEIRGIYATAGHEQKNLPHIVEFYGAMAGVTFFESKMEEKGNYFAVVPVDEINWRNIYKPVRGCFNFLMMMRFAFIMKSLILEELFDYAKMNVLKPNAQKIPWYYDFIDGKAPSSNLDTAKLYNLFEDISKYCEEYIRGFAELNISNINKIKNLDKIEYESIDDEGESDLAEYLNFFSKELLIKQHMNNQISAGKLQNYDEDEKANIYKNNLREIRKRFIELEKAEYYSDLKLDVSMEQIWSRICDLGFNSTLKKDQLFKNIEQSDNKSMEEGVRNLVNAIYIACMI